MRTRRSFGAGAVLSGRRPVIFAEFHRLMPASEPVSETVDGAPVAAVSQRARALKGETTVPGDKSISHRALILGTLATGETTIDGLLTGEDVLRTAAAMSALGAEIHGSEGPDNASHWKVRGRGIGGLSAPSDVIDLGNSGTGARLIAGVLSAYPFTSIITGDASLRKRPMARVTDPLSRTGAKFAGAAGGKLPMTITGTPLPVPLNYDSPVASAQVKSAVLLAGLHAPGETVVSEPATSRDHTERMFKYFGVDVDAGPASSDNGARYKVRITGQPELTGRHINVPGDPSSAAFVIVAALILPGSEITLRNVGLNPLRTGLFTTLEEMGANITYTNRRDEAGEPVADITAKASNLKSIAVPADRAPSMIDEYPILAVAAACAHGETRMDGLAELRVKESDRLTVMEKSLNACGVDARVEGDTLIVRGGIKAKGPVTIPVNLDHRIAMSFLVLGMAADHPVAIDDSSAMDTSYPGFIAAMNRLGAWIEAVDPADLPEPAV